LNANAGPDRQYEVLNFGVAAYSLLHQVRMLDDRVYKFHPDVVVLADGRHPQGPVVRHVTLALADGTLEAYPDLAEIVARAGVADYPGKGLPVPTNPLRKTAQALGLKARMPEREVTLRLTEIADVLIDWGMRHAADQARAHGAIPVYVDGMLPVDTLIADSPMLTSARKAGFVVIRLSPIFEGLPLDGLRIGSWDDHPTAKGMKVIADGLYAEFTRRDAELKLGIRK
jgi:hypothetical protein